MDGQKVQLDIEKHGGGMMMLLKELLRSGNYGRSGNRERQVRRNIYKNKKRLVELFTRPNTKHKGKDSETLYGRMIRNVIFVRFQRGWSKLIKILLVGSA